MNNKEYIDKITDEFHNNSILREYYELKRIERFWYDRIHYLSAVGGTVEEKYEANDNYNLAIKNLTEFLEKEVV